MQTVRQGMGQQVGEYGIGVHELEQGKKAVSAGTVVVAEVGEQIAAGELLVGDVLGEHQSDHHHLHLWRILQEQSVPESARRAV